MQNRLIQRTILLLLLLFYPKLLTRSICQLDGKPRLTVFLMWAAQRNLKNVLKLFSPLRYKWDIKKSALMSGQLMRSQLEQRALSLMGLPPVLPLSPPVSLQNLHWEPLLQSVFSPLNKHRDTKVSAPPSLQLGPCSPLSLTCAQSHTNLWRLDLHICQPLGELPWAAPLCDSQILVSPVGEMRNWRAEVTSTESHTNFHQFQHPKPGIFYSSRRVKKIEDRIRMVCIGRDL